MMRALVLSFALVMLAACDAADAALDREVRQQAEQTINKVVTDRFPGVDPRPVSNCLVNNATRGEILDLAKDSVTGVDGGTVETVLAITKRRETIKCLISNNLPGLLG